MKPAETSFPTMVTVIVTSEVRLAETSFPTSVEEELTLAETSILRSQGGASVREGR